MNERIKNIVKNPKILIALGITGIILVFASSFLSTGDTSKEKVSNVDAYNSQEYRMSLEQDIKNIVTGITGDKNPTVVITLESGVRYSYVSANEIDTSSTSGTSSDQSSESKKQSYITVRTSDGGEKALVVTEIMPEVRGVAIICSGGDIQATAEKIQNAVTAALNITSKRVYISGGTAK